MAQVFPKWTNLLPVVLLHLLAPAPLVAVGVVWYYGSPEFTDVGYRPKQPVPFSHQLHAGELGLDCRYCHATVEHSQEANVPPTQTCMNCHSQVKVESEALAPIRDSYKNDEPMEWVRVHNLPQYAYFDHSVHLRAGVGCASCHGRIDQMETVTLEKPLSMSWCLDCHRNPEPHLRDTDVTPVTKMDWVPPKNQLSVAADLIAKKKLAPPTDCAACHR